MKRSLLHVCRRRYSTAGTSAEVPNDPDILTTQTPETQGQQPKQPSIDLSKPYPRLQYKPPTLGVNPAYDEALRYIEADKRTKQKQLERTAIRLSNVTDAESHRAKALKLQQTRYYELAELNDPEVRWRFAMGDVDWSRPVYRHLAQQAWSQKQLLLIQQRVRQMFVTPDLIPFITPTVDVRLRFDDSPSFEVGQFRTSNQTRNMPKIEVQAWTEEEQKYVIAIIDTDVPDEGQDSYTSYLHYLQADVTLSGTQHLLSKENGSVLHDWVPPHPDKGTPYHRYSVIVWQQPKAVPQPTAPLAIGRNQIPRPGFSAQDFAKQNGLHAVGINFWRQVWDEQVTQIMADYPHVGYVEKNYKRITA